MFTRTICTTLLGTALCLTMLGSPSVARADASCANLIGQIQGTLAACGSGSACVAKAQQTTNFFQHISDFNQPQWGAYAVLTMRAGSASLDGSGNALFSNRFADAAHNQPLDFRQPRSRPWTWYSLGPTPGRSRSTMAR